MRCTLTAILCLGLSLSATGAWASVYDLPPKGADVVGKIQRTKTRASNTFVALSRTYDIGFEAIKLANPRVDPWLPGEGTSITLPTRYVLPDAPRKGIVVNLAEMRLYYYPPQGHELAGKVVTHPLGVGRQGWSTPLGKTQVASKIPRPSWTVPASIRKEHAENGDPLPKVVPAGPNNPLGQYAMRLGMPSYLIHGTNKPRGIGMRVSHGCIRLYPEDIKSLFSRVDPGTPVYIVDQPYKAGWDGDTLMLEIHPPSPKDKSGHNKASKSSWVEAIVKATSDSDKHAIDWDAAQRVAARGDGIPEPISKGRPTTATNIADRPRTGDEKDRAPGTTRPPRKQLEGNSPKRRITVRQLQNSAAQSTAQDSTSETPYLTN